MTTNEIILKYTEMKAYANAEYKANAGKFTNDEAQVIQSIIKLLDGFLYDLKKLRETERN